jgi:YggT family protein
MFVVGNLLSAIAKLLDFVVQAVVLVLFINALLSWVRPDPSNPIVQFLDRVSDAVCAPIRRIMPTVFGGFDLAPLIAMVVLWYGVHEFIVPSLYGMAVRM